MGKILEFKQVNESEENDNQKPPKKGGMTPFILICLLVLIIIMSLLVFKDDLINLLPSNDEAEPAAETVSPSASASPSPEGTVSADSSIAVPSESETNTAESILNLQKELSLESTAENQFLEYQNGFLCVNSTEVIYYDSSGEKKSSYPLNMPDPIVAVNGKYIAVGSRGSSELILLNDMQLQRKETLPSNLTAVDITEKGEYAVVCEDESYKNRLIVKNSAGEELFVWLSADGYITAVNFSKSGRNIAVSTLNTTDQIASEILMFDIYETEPLVRQKFADEMVISLQVTDNQSIMAIFEQKARIIDKEGNQLREYDFQGMELTSYAWDKEGNLVLAFWNNSGGKVTILNSFDEKLEENVFTAATEVELTSLCGDRIVLSFANQIYVLGLDAASIFNTALPQDASVENVLVFNSGKQALAAKKTAAYILGLE